MKGCADKVVVGATYRHFKGGLYKVLDIRNGYARDISVVVYQSMQDQKTYYRTSTDFCSSVAVDGKSMLRFSLIEESNSSIPPLKEFSHE